ncbi:MAG: SoxR reducing system RseC family protein [Firmicutes bacterium]|nr:SoxR reducing system RseC family protein [Bacillota bacterium]
MRQRGVVIDKKRKEVVVRFEDPKSVCGDCKGCIRLTPDRPSEEYVVRLADPKDQYDIGDEVIVDGDMGPVVKAVAVLYGIPFISLFVGYGVTRLLYDSDPLAGLGGIVGLILGAVVSKLVTRRFFVREAEMKIVARACS